jgi:hypothetical protein
MEVLLVVESLGHQAGKGNLAVEVADVMGLENNHHLLLSNVVELCHYEGV